MSSYTFRPAVRENVGLLIGIVGASGSGKTFTAFRLASGIAGDKPFAVIDTENRRALHYADQFAFHHLELRAPFRPDAYAKAIRAADEAGYPVIVVDSASHEHAGDGGLLDWHDEELDRIAGEGADWRRREACNMAAWIKPKMAHKQMVSELLQVRAHLILCFRAEEKVEMTKDEKGKTVIVPKKSLVGVDGWIPICEKTLPYELTVSVLLTADRPGVPRPIKLQEQHRALFPADKQITEASGRAIAAWAAGGSKAATPRETNAPDRETERAPSETTGSQSKAPAKTISESQALDLETVCRDNGISVESLCKAAKVERLSDIAILDLPRAKTWIDAAIERRKSA